MTTAAAPPRSAQPTTTVPTTVPTSTVPAATVPTTTVPAVRPPCRAPDRRPRLRRPGHEPEPVVLGAHSPARRSTRPGASAGAPRPAPADLAPSPYGPAPAVRPTAEEADLRRAAVDTVRRMVEVLAGRRAPAHLTGVAQPHVVRYLVAARDTAPTGRAVAPPRRVHVARPSPDAAEITAVCPFGRRSRALAVRMDRVPDGRRAAWRASAVRLL